MMFNREGINQNIEGMTNNAIMLLSQFNEKLKLVLGSKEENRFVIIFN